MESAGILCADLGITVHSGRRFPLPIFQVRIKHDRKTSANSTLRMPLYNSIRLVGVEKARFLWL